MGGGLGMPANEWATNLPTLPGPSIWIFRETDPCPTKKDEVARRGARTSEMGVSLLLVVRLELSHSNPSLSCKQIFPTRKSLEQCFLTTRPSLLSLTCHIFGRLGILAKARDSGELHERRDRVRKQRQSRRAVQSSSEHGKNM